MRILSIFVAMLYSCAHGWRYFLNSMKSLSKQTRLASSVIERDAGTSRKVSDINIGTQNRGDVPPRSHLTQKDYFQSIRNRLFAVEEQLWLHQYAVDHHPSPIVDPFPQETVTLLLAQKEAMIQELPLQSLEFSKKLAEEQNLTHAAKGLNRRIDDLHRLMHLPEDHINQIAVSSFQGQIMHLIRGHGTISHRLLSNEDDDNVEVRIAKSNRRNRNLRRQFQHLTFSPDHHYCGAIESIYPVLSEMDNVESDGNNGDENLEELHHVDKHEQTFNNHLNPNPIHSSVLVYEVENSPHRYGGYESRPFFDSGALPSAPFHMQFSPDNHQLIFLCSPYNQEAASGNVSLVALNWQKYLHLPPTKDATGRIVDAHIAGATAETLLEGESIYFTYSTSLPANASILVHIYKSEEKNDNTVGDCDLLPKSSEVWMFTTKSMETGENVFVGKKLCSETYTSQKENQTKWFTPQCHSAGGGDNVVLVEDGFLVTKALSRWKRTFPKVAVDDSNKSTVNGFDSLARPAVKRLLPMTGGQVHFLVSPDHSKLVVLEEQIPTGSARTSNRIRAVTGEDILDPLNPSSVLMEEENVFSNRLFDIPIDEQVVAFWFSPDSTQLLLLSHVQDDDYPSLSAELGEENIRLKASIYNFPMKQIRALEIFKPTSYFLKTYVTHFTQYAQAFNPWSPDSKSFLYITSAGLHQVPVVESKYSVGMGSWLNQGVSFASWSRA